MLDTTEAVRRWKLDTGEHAELLQAVHSCTTVVEAALREADFSPPLLPGGRDNCEPDALDAVIDRPDERSDVRVTPDLTAAAVLNTGGIATSVQHPTVVERREEVDRLLTETLIALGLLSPDLALAVSGHFWYPAGSHMGWHTNSRVPGPRFYLTAVAEPDQSFFRWRDSESGVIETSWDTALDLRRFSFDADTPFWHCIWAGVPRHSFGYRPVVA